MRVAIIGAGAVGRSVAKELFAKGHEIVVVDCVPAQSRRESMASMTWVIGDAAELDTLARAQLDQADIMVAATGDDKVNLVVSLLAKTEFGVPRTVARVSHPSNEWMFDSRWGVDVAVSTPRIMTALVEEAVSVGRVVKIFSFADSTTHMVEITASSRSRAVGSRVGAVAWPAGTVLVGIVRQGRPHPPHPDLIVEPHDELLFMADGTANRELESILGAAPTEANELHARHDELPGRDLEDYS